MNPKLLIYPGMFFKYKPSSPGSLSVISSQTLDHDTLALITPGPGIWQLGASEPRFTEITQTSQY